MDDQLLRVRIAEAIEILNAALENWSTSKVRHITANPGHRYPNTPFPLNDLDFRNHVDNLKEIAVLYIMLYDFNTAWEKRQDWLNYGKGKGWYK